MYQEMMVLSMTMGDLENIFNIFINDSTRHNRDAGCIRRDGWDFLADGAHIATFFDKPNTSTLFA